MKTGSSATLKTADAVTLQPSSIAKSLEPFVCGGAAATFASIVIHPMDLAKVCKRIVFFFVRNQSTRILFCHRKNCFVFVDYLTARFFLENWHFSFFVSNRRLLRSSPENGIADRTRGHEIFMAATALTVMSS